MQLFQTEKPNSLLEPQSRKLAACLLSAFNAAKPDALQKSLMKDFGLIIQTILKKLMEKCCPLNYDLVRNASYLTPDNISLKKKAAIAKFGKLVTKIYENKHFKC